MIAPSYILALDYGKRRTGVAIAHEIARLARPLTTLATTDNLYEDVRQIVIREGARLVVVGLPRGMDGGYTAQTKSAEAFAKILTQYIDVPVVLSDETLTSVDAEAALGDTPYSKEAVDALAATFILERYFVDNPVRTAI